LQSGDPVSAYSHAFLGHVLCFRALKDAGRKAGEAVSEPVLLAAMVSGLAAESLGEPVQAHRARTFVAELGYDIHDNHLLTALAR
jgi:hypothetical protein